MASFDDLKALKRRLSEVEADAKVAAEKVKTATQEQRRTQEIIRSLDRQIKAIEESNVEKKITVTDHAIVQYFSRVLGMDMAELKNQIAGVDKVPFKNGRYPVNGHLIVVKNNAVVTVIKN